MEKQFKFIVSLIIVLTSLSQVNAQMANIETTPVSGGTFLGPINFKGNPQVQATAFDFNTGTLPVGWTSTSYDVASPCDTDPADGSYYFWAKDQDASGHRYVITSAVDVADGGNIEFYIRYGADDPSSTCEDPDLEAEEVILQYSTDNGNTWNTIYNSWDVVSDKSAAWYDWYWTSIAIPSAAQTTSTKFRWYQESSSSSTNDHWGLDDVSIGAAVTVDSHSWKINGTEVSTVGSTLNYTFPATGTYTVSYSFTSSDGNASDVISYVIKPDDPTGVSATATTICSGDEVTLTANGAQGTVYWYTGSCGGTPIGSGNPITVNPITTTTYYASNYENEQYSPGCASATITVRPDFTPGAIATTGETICSSGTPGSIGNSTSASGGDGIITYSWRSSADNYATVISGAAGPTYTPPAGLIATTSYRRYAHDSSCNTTPEVSTGTWTVTVAPLMEYQSKQSGEWTVAANWEQYNGTDWVDATSYPGEITSSCGAQMVTVQSNDIMTLSSGSVTIPGLTIKANGIVQKDLNATLSITGQLIMEEDVAGGIQIISTVD